MTQIFDRKYELNITSVDGQSRSISELRIEFEITKSILSFPNVARITIFNYAPETRVLLEQRHAHISLNAGYEGNVGLLFQGEVRNVFASRDRELSTLTVYAGDGQKDWENAAINKTFSESVSVSAAIQEVLGSFQDTPVGYALGLPDTPDKLRGQTLSGPSREIMDQFAEEYGFEWSIQNGEIVIVPLNEAIDSDEAIVISSETGMIGTPTITEIGADVTTALDARIIPNAPIEIRSASAEVAINNLYFRDVKKTDASGFYKVMEVTFRGDSHGNEWTASIKGGYLHGV